MLRWAYLTDLDSFLMDPSTRQQIDAYLCSTYPYCVRLAACLAVPVWPEEQHPS
ncbi:hypothetical protein [Streptacidiphilus monticola]|uniref:hypothetical protein n=1 Tax=Streptacidiphilus monticola TaxID=2161674 RepID=UPI0036D2EA61